MFVIGSHLSISKGYLNMGKEATKIGGNTFQYFTRDVYKRQLFTVVKILIVSSVP